MEIELVSYDSCNKLLNEVQYESNLISYQCLKKSVFNNPTMKAATF